MSVCFYSCFYPESDDVRLVGGTSHCSGTLEVKHQGEWRPADDRNWNKDSSTVVCRQLDCGSAVSTETSSGFPYQPVWRIASTCGSESSLRECVTAKQKAISTFRLQVICSGNKQ